MTAATREATDVSELTDRLTGLGSRRRLMVDLGQTAAAAAGSKTLALFHLSGFSRYVDLYGRLEGEALLVRLAGRLSELLGATAACYRPRDDEFAALVEGPPAAAEPLVLEAAAALTARFEQFDVTLAFGAAVVPDEAGEPIEAMSLADTRLFLRAEDRRPRDRRRAPRAQPR